MEALSGGVVTVLAELERILDPGGVVTDPALIEAALTDWRRMVRGRALAVLRPACASALAGAVALCAEAGIAMVPQGGNTSMVGGAVPDDTGASVVISLARLNRVRALDPVARTLTVEAGVTLAAAKTAAAEAGLLLGLSIASEGSAQIGGVLSTNAGGVLTLRHGNARDLVLGLEVVLADGSLWDGLRSLRKDNTGYALRHLFVGAEGTLGIITAAVLRLVAAPKETAVAFASCPSAQAVLDLYGRFCRFDEATLAAFEYMGARGIELVLAHMPRARLPVAAGPHYALVELASARVGAGLRATLEEVLEAALAEGEVGDAAIAESGAQAASFWRLREDHAEAQRLAGPVVRNDVSVPVAAVPEFLARACAAVGEVLAGVEVVAFGHVGDGNIHFNLRPPEGSSAGKFLAHTSNLMGAVNRVVRDLGGSFSAEHGVGRLKRGLMAEWRAGAELEMMRRIKAALDPRGVMNPGVLLP